MPNSRLDATWPLAEQPKSDQSASVRYLSIDVLRAVAILLMIQVHAVDHFSEEIVRSGYLFEVSRVLGRMSAPLFALMTGLSYALWLRAQTRARESADTIVKYSLRRGMFVFGLGLVVNFFIWLPDATFDWDILALIGVAAILLVWMRNWHPGVLIAICIVILLVTPPLRDVVNYQSYWDDDDYNHESGLGEVTLGLFLIGYFPLLPWLIFPLTGFVLGRLFYQDDKAVSLPLAIPLLGALMIVLALLGAVFQAQAPSWIAGYYATGWPQGVYLATTVYVLGTLGVVLICLWILNRGIDLNHRATGTGHVLTFFRRYSQFALTAYVAHLAIQLWPLWIRAWWERKQDLEFYAGKVMTVPSALISALVLIIVLYLLFIFLDRHKRYSLEYFMRWICH